MTRRLIAAIALVGAAVATSGCGTQAQVRPDPSASDEPSAAQVAKWPMAWCTLHAGMARADAIAAMGAPTETFNDQNSWDGFGYHFTAFYDETGAISQLDVNDIQMTAEQKAKIMCASTRTGSE